MKKGLITLILILCVAMASSQQRIIDSIKAQMPTTNDTLMLVWSRLLRDAYDVVHADSLSVYGKMYLELCKKLDFPLQEVDALQLTAVNIARTNAPEALRLLVNAQNIIEHPGNRNLLPSPYLKMLRVPPRVVSFQEYRQYLLGVINSAYGWVYWISGKNDRAFDYFERSLEVSRTVSARELTALCYIAFGILTEHADSSLTYLHEARQLGQEIGTNDIVADAENFMAQRYAKKKDFQSELFYRMSSLDINQRFGLLTGIGWSYLGMADYYNRSVTIKDSAVSYSHKAMEIADQTHSPHISYWAALNLSNFYKEEGIQDSAYKYLELLLQSSENISNEENAREFENIDYAQQSEAAAIKASEEALRNRVKTYSFVAGISVLIVLAIIFWRSKIRKQREYKLLQDQKAKTDEALDNLKATQMQLVQSEKMASLGELTAGIAHEIQNPLNFVNNFSDLSNELLAEMNEKLEEGNLKAAKEIATDIEQNLEKINYHGKRADAIVKGMLQHSRKSSGTKEPTDINKLADEYLRLAYHGLRAKDKLFNATIRTDFDQSIGQVNIVPHDIGRVLLNLVNNAFYTVFEKKNLLSDEYEPTVSVRTKRYNGQIDITVSDNGNGIPKAISDKVFQPFFTTKPTGQGTGLGLSLAYDIVKVYGGEIKLETEEGVGSTFTISLPNIQTARPAVHESSDFN